MGVGEREYSQAGHVYCEHAMDVTNGSIHTERVLYEQPSPEEDPSDGWRGGVKCTARLHSALVCCLCRAVVVLPLRSMKLSVNSSCLLLAHLLPPARLCAEHGVRERACGERGQRALARLCGLVWISSSKQLSDVGAITVPV